MNGNDPELSHNGWDIAPDEDRYSRLINVITLDDNLEPVYQQMHIARPENAIYEEILDQSEDNNFARYFQTQLAARPPSTDPKYYSELERLKSYNLMWLEDYHVKPADLARDGFIHIGPRDKVKCVFCLKCLSKWERNDSVEGEHRKHYPDCPFINGKCDHLNIPINSALNMKKSMGLKIKPTIQQDTDLTEPYCDFKDRLNTYKTWPKMLPIRPDALAEAGFYYLDSGDKVQCFKCKQIISEWEPGDDPWFEHAKWVPDCEYLKSRKGSEVYKMKKDKDSAPMEATNENNTKKSSNGEKEQISNTAPHQIQDLKYPIQVSASELDIERALENAHLQAVCQIYDVTTKEMRHLLKEIRSNKDSSLEIPPVRKICEDHDIPIDKMKEMLTSIMMAKGSNHNAKNLGGY